MRGVELAGLLACVGSKFLDQVFVDEPEHVVSGVLVHGDILDEFE